MVYAVVRDSIKLHNIPEVCVYQDRQSLFKEDKFITRIDSLTLQKNQNINLGELLMFSTPVVIQQYGGTGSLTTLSFRGTGSNHTQVNWNGFPLNAIGSDEMDLSLAGSDISNDIQLIHGASGAMYGNGTFGGAIELNNIPDWSNKLYIKLNSEVGAFDNNINEYSISSNPGQIDSKKYSIKINAGTNTMQYSFYGFNNNALNEYKYVENDFIPQNITQNHNQYFSQGFIQTYNLKIDNAQQLEAGMWAQQKHYQIPGNSYNGVQNDSTLKTYLKWNYFSGTSNYTIKTGYFYDYLHYTSLLMNTETNKPTNSKIGSGRWYNDFNYRKYLSYNITFDGGFTFLRTFSINNNFTSLQIDENMFAIYSATKYSILDIIFDFSFRQEFITGYKTLPQFSFGECWKLNSNILLKSNISNKFRVPSFNERYWMPGGNPNLKPENGLGFDAGTEMNVSNSVIKNRFIATIYSNIINNWIQWIPNGPTGLMAENYEQVWTRGFEGTFRQTINLGKNGINWNINYNYTPSTYSKSYDSQTIGKQLIYVPLHSAVFNLNFKLHSYNIGFDWAIRSQYYSNADESGLPSPGYSLVNFNFNKTFKLKTNNFRIDFKINNFFDKQYYTYLPTYPMPGRTFYIAMTYVFNKSNY
jgi:outer membrane cobalamin receptor